MSPARFAQTIAAHAVAKPTAIAIDGGTDVGLDWTALERTLSVITQRLRQDLVGHTVVGLAIDHSAAACLLDLALCDAGIATIQLPPFFTSEQRLNALAAAGCSALVTRASLVPGLVDPLQLEVGEFDHEAVALPKRTGKISFTSGSSGTPKGICLSTDHLIGVAKAVVEQVGAEHAGRHLPVLPPGILLETVAGLYATILAGGTYVPRGQADIGLANAFSPDLARLLGVILGEEITSLILVPEYLAGLVGAMEATGLRLPRLTLVAVGGARIAPALLERAAMLGLPVRQGYGLTECGSVVALERDDGAPRGSVGSSLGSHRIRLADDGEIVIDGPAFLGTIGAPREPGPLRTGDLGRFDEYGRLWIAGRKSTLLITSFGRNISPEWVEGVLVDQTAIAQAVVRGDGAPALEALIVAASPEADLGAAVAAANATLPGYARIANWRAVPPFTPMNGQLTGNGRLKRAAINTSYSERIQRMPFFDRLVAETRDEQARFAKTPQLIAGLTGQITLRDYVAYLTQAYHHVRHTVPLMQEARSRLSAKPRLVKALDDYIEEETGHEYWILDDIDAAGGDGAATGVSDPAPATAAMVAHAYRTIRTGNPAAFFGMVYVLEGTSIAMASNGADAVRQRLGLPPEAFRYLMSHGALDQDHMVFFASLMNEIDDPDDQDAIVQMARDIFGLFGGMFAGIDLESARAAA